MVAKGFKGKYFSFNAIVATVSTVTISSFNISLNKKFLFDNKTTGLAPPI